MAGIRTIARKEGDDYVLNGQKTFITNGTRADFVTLLAKTSPDKGAHGCSFFLVPTALRGFNVAKKLKKIGSKSSDTAELFLEDVRVPGRYLLGEPDQGFAYLMQNFQTERLVAAVSAIASSFMTLGGTVEYGRERVAFGKPIIKRESWQHKLVDLYTRCEAARAFAYKCVDHYNDERYVRKVPISFDTVESSSRWRRSWPATWRTTSWTPACSSTEAGATSRTSRSARAWRDQRLLRIGGGTTETMKYYLAKLMNF